MESVRREINNLIRAIRNNEQRQNQVQRANVRLRNRLSEFYDVERDIIRSEVLARYAAIENEREERRQRRRESGLGPYPEPIVDVDNQEGHPAYKDWIIKSFDKWLNEWIPDDVEDELSLLEIDVIRFFKDDRNVRMNQIADEILDEDVGDREE